MIETTPEPSIVRSIQSYIWTKIPRERFGKPDQGHKEIKIGLALEKVKFSGNGRCRTA